MSGFTRRLQQSVAYSNAAGVTWKSGSWQSIQNGGPGNTPAAHRAFGTWRGRPETIVNTYASTTTNGDWSSIDNPSVLATYKGTEFAGSNFLLSVDLYPPDGNLADGAAGTYDSYYATLASNLVSQGFADCYIRAGYEFNGTFTRWAATGSATDANNYRWLTQRFVSALRSGGWAGKYVWCPNNGNSGTPVDPTACYPGDDYVDVIGPDAYDIEYGAGYTDQTDADAARATRWNFINTGSQGLDSWSSFCQAGTLRMDSSTSGTPSTVSGSAKPFCLPEWGTANWDWQDNGAGGDDPYYFQQLFNFLSGLESSKGVSVEFETLFNEDYPSPGPYHRIDSGVWPKPNAAAMYQSLWR